MNHVFFRKRTLSSLIVFIENSLAVVFCFSETICDAKTERLGQNIAKVDHQVPISFGFCIKLYIRDKILSRYHSLLGEDSNE